jgi:AraC-like DNA-binding protein
MSIEFRAIDEPVSTRHEYWRHVVNEEMFPVDGRPVDGPDFDGRLVSGAVGAVRVADVTAPAAECVRSSNEIRRSDHELYHIDVLAGGNVTVEHEGRQTRLWPGDFTVIDPSRPCRWISTGARHVAVTFPRVLLPLRREELSRLTGMRLRGDHGTGALVSSVARQLPRYLDDVQTAEGARLGTTVVDLLTVALAARLDRGSAVPAETGQRAMRMRVHAFIEERLSDPGLGPVTIAAAHHISVRYLHKLFESEQTTVADWIRRRRLERCRRDLLDPDFRTRPVSAIGVRWGFPDASRFSRVFRAEHGVPPGEYRLMGGVH